MQNSIFNTYENDDQIQMKTCAKETACIFVKNITKIWQFAPKQTHPFH